MSNMNFDREFDWNDEITQDSGEFLLLPEGDYKFIVESYERGRHQPQPGGKLPACNEVAGKEGVCKIGQREYNGNKYNEVKRMIYKDDVDLTKVLNKDVPGFTQTGFNAEDFPF